MKNVNNAWKIYSILFTALCVTYALSDQPGTETRNNQPRAILNAKELGIDDLDIDLDSIDDVDVDFDASEEVVEDVVDEAAEEVDIIEDVVEESIEEAVEEVTEVEETVEDVVEETAEEAEIVEDVVEEATEEVVEEVTEIEEIVEDVVEETAEEAEIVEDVVEEATEEAVENTNATMTIDEEIDAILGFVDDSIETTEEETPEETVEVEEVVETATEETPVVAVVDDPIVTAVDEAMTIESARRSAYDKHVIQCIKTSEDDLARGKYDTVIKALTEVQPYVRESRVDLRNKVEENLAEAYYRKAINFRQAKNYEEAEAVARQARSLAHPNADELIFQIRDEQENPPVAPPPKRLKRWTEKEYQEFVLDIDDRMKRAREYYATGEYDLCRREVEFCLRDYPWCKDAVGMLRKVNTRLGEFYDNERLATRKDMLAKVTKTWTPPTYGLEYEDAGYNSRGMSNSEDSVTTLGTTEEMKILEKMKRITIPEIDFRQANITDVITFLSEASREYDPDEDIPEERRGINIILNLGSSADTQTSAPTTDSFGGGWDSAMEETTTVASTGGVPPITTSARFVTLLDAMNMIMDVAKLKYRVKGNMVLVMPANAPDGDLIHRMYPVLPSFVEKAQSLREEDKGSGDFGDAIELQTTHFEDKQDWKQFFGELGVQWPEGSTVKYVGSIGKLIVKNTSEQLASLEKVLAELNVTPHQVEIEVRFVEVGQKDLDSLGFEWQVNENWGLLENAADSGKPYEQRRRLEIGAGNVTSGFNFLTKGGVEEIDDGQPIEDGILKFSSILTNPELSLILHMLSSKKNSDLLSAPKVVTASGREATIKVVTEYIYPTTYDVEMLESDNGDNDDGGTTYAGAVVEPGDFMTREVGVILSVTPEVAPDGTRIYLRLAPSVISEPTWKNYGSEYPMSVPVEQGFLEQILDNGTLGLLPFTQYETKMAQLNMEQPFFPVRSIVTELDVYNGSTVVMGGMITEERIACEDKIPILGDIPIIGHLFRHKYEQSDKRNLLLFVTARLVDAGGREVKNTSSDSIFMD